MLTIFLENTWEEIITNRGFSLFLKKGLKLESNLFRSNPKKLSDLKSTDLIVATNPQLRTLKKAGDHNIPVIFYTLFPDQITGWDYNKNEYRKSLIKGFEERIVQVDKILVNSLYTKKFLETHLSCQHNITTCHLGIDFESISIISKNTSRTRNKMRILWNHMWRKDKGFIYALSTILVFAKKYPKIEFHIGRREDWGGGNLNELKKFYQYFLNQLDKHNIRNVFISDKFEVQEDYWNFLSTFDISFSCSPHETFGISMLEQQAAGIACVVPKQGVYREVHKGSFQVPIQRIDKGLEELINDKNKLHNVSKACVKNAVKYNIDTFVQNFSKHILGVIKQQS